MQNSIRNIAINQTESSGHNNGLTRTAEAMRGGYDSRVIQSLDVSIIPISKLLEETEVNNNTESFTDVLNASIRFNQNRNVSGLLIRR